MNGTLRMLISVGLLGFLPCIPLGAQEPADEDVTQGVVYDEYRGLERPYTRLEGAALPSYLVVEAFFYSASLSLDRSVEVWNGFLSQLEILPGSGAEAALTKAVLAARDSVLVSLASAPDSQASQGSSPTAEEQVQHARDQVHSLATIYASLLLDLAAHGYQGSRLQDHLEYKVRPAMSLTMYPDPTSDENLDTQILAEKRKFDGLVTHALDAERLR